MNKELLKEMIEKRYVNVQKHPTADLYIYNYTNSCQFDRMWNEVTLQCRGLIMDGKGKIVARPFPKFFNYQEIPNLPAENFVATEKMDGSLIILSLVDDVPCIATRGSFVSSQAKKATEILQRDYSHVKFDKNITYLFELICPENRIVVDYGTREALILLAMIETETGEEWSYNYVNFFAVVNKIPVVGRYHGFDDFKTLEQRPNSEGYVIRYDSGLRVKIKFDEYKRLHRLVSRVNSKTIWEILKNGDSYQELLDRVPDEFYNWIQKKIMELQSRYSEIELQSINNFQSISHLEDRKEFASRAKKMKYSNVIFAMKDGKDYKEMIWKMIRPSTEKPFKDLTNS